MNDAPALLAFVKKHSDKLPFVLSDDMRIITWGRGESNDNYVLLSGDDKLILRVAKGRANLLENELDVLGKTPEGVGPKVFFYLSEDGLDVLAEEYVEGVHVLTWTDEKIKALVATVAKAHSVTSANAQIRDQDVSVISLKDYVDSINQPFVEGIDTSLLGSVPERMEQFCQTHQHLFDQLHEYALIHADLAPMNSLFNEATGQLRLIDWEFAHFFDPARDFASFFYNGIDYNGGKWRVNLNERQQSFLTDEYLRATGKDIAERLKIWLEIDKYTSAAWLNWRLQTYHDTDRVTLSYDDLKSEALKILSSIGA